MLGYVKPNREELKTREWDLYQGYYCGICKSIGRRLGQGGRLVLSYDAVFLAMILAALSGKKERIAPEHCIVHPIDRKPTVRGVPEIDYAADMMIILAYHKCLDDWDDERSLKGLGGKALLERAYRKLKGRYPAVCREVEESIDSLRQLEREKSACLDAAMKTSALATRSVFTHYFGGDGPVDRILGELGENLGAWVYLIDALDDLKEDEEKDRYNPLRYRPEGTKHLSPVLYHLLANINSSVDLLDIKKNSGIISNIVLLGMRAQTDLVLQPYEEETNRSTSDDERSI